MAIISTFLCWSNTRTGSAVCGYYTLIISVVCLAFYMLRYIALDHMEDSIELKGIVYAGFVLYSSLISVSLILLPGVYMDKKFLLLPWIYVLVITILYETGAIALITTVHLERDHTLHTWEIIAVVFYCVRLMANCYSFACVVSQYQELSEGRGTFEFLYKPHGRHLTRRISLTDSEEYNPPYGASLPPYSEDNPYKHFSPPNYENLALKYEEMGTFASSNIRGDITRSRYDGSSYYLADGLVGQSFSGCDSDGDYSEGYNEDHNGKDVYSYVSSYGSFEDASDFSGRPDLFELPSRCGPLQREEHYSHLRSQENAGNSFSNEGVVSMTSSSACLMNNSSDRTYMSYKKPARSKQSPVSPLAIKKRTYITWI